MLRVLAYTHEPNDHARNLQGRVRQFALSRTDFMTMLTIDAYENRERAAVEDLPNRVVEMVSPVVFASEGYPIRVRRESELWKFVDAMHETRFEDDFARLLDGGITEQEFARLRHLAELAHRFSWKEFGRNLTTRGSLIRALHVYRQIADVFEDRPTRVFEIGPGSGYLGCLFLVSGWCYGATDITQAFYLQQNRLWSELSADSVTELANDATWDGTYSPGRPVHIPWWEFYSLHEKDVPQVDVVTCNHALAEMHPNSLSFTLRVAHTMLRGSGIKAFIFEGWGYEKFVQRSAIAEQFYRFGFRLVHNDEKITVFSPSENACSKPSPDLPCRLTSSPPISFERRLLNAIRRRLYLRVTVPACPQPFPPPVLSSDDNPLSQRILEARQRRAGQKLVKIGRVNAFYTELLGSNDHRSPDERFLNWIGKTY